MPLVVLASGRRSKSLWRVLYEWKSREWLNSFSKYAGARPWRFRFLKLFRFVLGSCVTALTITVSNMQANMKPIKKCHRSKRQVKAPLTEKTWGRGWVGLVVKTKKWRITPSSISIILHKILSHHSLIVIKDKPHPYSGSPNVGCFHRVPPDLPKFWPSGAWDQGKPRWRLIMAPLSHYLPSLPRAIFEWVLVPSVPKRPQCAASCPCAEKIGPWWVQVFAAKKKIGFLSF